jgi:hypothetical protein
MPSQRAGSRSTPCAVVEALEGFEFDGLGNGPTEYRAADHQCFKDVLVVKGKENPSSEFDLLEIVEVTPRRPGHLRARPPAVRVARNEAKPGLLQLRRLKLKRSAHRAFTKNPGCGASRRGGRYFAAPAADLIARRRHVVKGGGTDGRIILQS